jgi:hypothetical protein
MHHGIHVGEGWYQVKLGGIMEGNGNIKLRVPNRNDDPPQLKLKDVVGSKILYGKQKTCKKLCGFLLQHASNKH